MASRASVSTLLLRPLAAALEGSPKSLEAFFAATDLTPSVLGDSEARVSPAQLCVAWAEALRLSGDPALALRIADRVPPGSFGVVEYVCGAAPTLRDALRQWARYLGILDDAIEVGLVDTALRVITDSEAPAPASHELCFALVARRAAVMLGNGFRLTAVNFAHPAPEAHRMRHREFFGCDVHFGTKHTEMLFDASVLDMPLATADPNLLAILEPVAAQKHAPSEPALIAQVRRALRAALSSDDAQLENVAKRLGMTTRSLQRRLKEEGVVFQTLRDETRRELADRYLGQQMSLSEIAFLLGFSEPSAFFRAFKRWTGITPLERRESLQGG